MAEAAVDEPVCGAVEYSSQISERAGFEGGGHTDGRHACSDGRCARSDGRRAHADGGRAQSGRGRAEPARAGGEDGPREKAGEARVEQAPPQIIEDEEALAREVDSFDRADGRVIAAQSYGQLPPCGIDCFDVPAQVKSQLEPPEHATEHEPLHVTWHVEPLVHEMLPLAPSVTVQVDSLLQSMLHDWLQLPEQSFLSVQAREQLPPAPQLFAVKSQLAPVGQLQLAPVHVTGIELLEPQAVTQRIAIKPSSFMSPSMVGRAWSSGMTDERERRYGHRPSMHTGFVAPG